MSDELESLRATEIPDKVLFGHLRLDPEYASDEDKVAAKGMLLAALAYIRERCGIDDKYLDAHPDLAIAALALARDMYDNRSAQEQGSASITPTVASILAVHDFNLLCRS